MRDLRKIAQRWGTFVSQLEVSIFPDAGHVVFFTVERIEIIWGRMVERSLNVWGEKEKPYQFTPNG